MKRIAIFDIDGTLLKENTSIILLKSLYKDKKISLWTLIKAKYYNYLFRKNKFSIEDMRKYSLKFMKGWNKNELEKYCKKIFEEKIKDKLLTEIIEKINYHKNKKYLIILLTTAPELISNHIKEYVKADFSINSIIQSKNGIITGEFDKLCFENNKYVFLKEFLIKKKINLNKSYFYTDSYTDLKVLKLVEFPIAVNPDKSLKDFAEKKGWDIITPQNE
jgi:HAD superfamily hydrolase (TIGR01490 family)